MQKCAIHALLVLKMRCVTSPEGQGKRDSPSLSRSLARSLARSLSFPLAARELCTHTEGPCTWPCNFASGVLLVCLFCVVLQLLGIEFACAARDRGFVVRKAQQTHVPGGKPFPKAGSRGEGAVQLYWSVVSTQYSIQLYSCVHSCTAVQLYTAVRCGK